MTGNTTMVRTWGAGLLALFAISCTTAAPPEPASAPVSNRSTDSASLERIESTLIELSDRLEVMGARIQKLEEGQSPSEPAATQPRRQTAVTPPPAAPRVAGPTPTPPVTRPPAAKPRPPVVTPPQTASEPKRTNPVEGARIADRYREALMLYGRSNMPEARRVFQEVVDADPTGELADNALFWLGETFFAAGDYSEALKYYRRVEVDYGDQNKAPDAMLKTGLTHVKRGDLLLAKSAFEKLIAAHPYSTPAATARQELKRIRY